MALSTSAVEHAGSAEGILISCGGLRTLGVAKPLEDRHHIPVVSSATAALWAALRLVGESGRVPGYGQLLEQAEAPVR
jgi:arylmalonate decarboxylase